MKQMVNTSNHEIRLNRRSELPQAVSYELKGEEFGDYLITDNAYSDRLFHKFKAIHVEQKLPAFIKILRPECVGNENFTQQFIVLVEHLRTVVHSSIVPVMEGGFLYGQHYIIEEQFEGFALGRGLENEHFDHEDKIKVVNQVGSALMALHHEGIIHGEINPAHVFITVDDISKLGGFGVPHFMQKCALNPPILKVEKRRFVAPEVLAGEPSTKASDLYSFASLVGCIFTTEEKWSKSDSRLSGLSLSPKLLHCLQKGMSKNPKHRHASVDEFLTELNRMFSKTDVQKAKPSLQIPSDQRDIETDEFYLHDVNAVVVSKEPTVHHSSERNSKLSFPLDKKPITSANVSLYSFRNITFITVLIAISGVGMFVMNKPSAEAESAASSGVVLVAENPDLKTAAATPLNSPVESHLAVDENWPGFLRIVSLPDSGVAWKVPAVLLFDDETQVTKNWYARLKQSPKTNELLGTFLKIRTTQNTPASLANQYRVTTFPTIILTASDGRQLARLTPKSTPVEVETTLELIKKGLKQ
ncbi:MAG: protein kinase [Sumerlaeia bacterium]